MHLATSIDWRLKWLFATFGVEFDEEFQCVDRQSEVLFCSAFDAASRDLAQVNQVVPGGSVAEWLACWTQAQKGPGSNRSRDAVG